MVFIQILNTNYIVIITKIIFCYIKILYCKTHWSETVLLPNCLLLKLCLDCWFTGRKNKHAKYRIGSLESIIYYLPVDNSLRFMAKFVMGEFRPHGEGPKESFAISTFCDMLGLVLEVTEVAFISFWFWFRFNGLSGVLDIMISIMQHIARNHSTEEYKCQWMKVSLTMNVRLELRTICSSIEWHHLPRSSGRVASVQFLFRPKIRHVLCHTPSKRLHFIRWYFSAYHQISQIMCYLVFNIFLKKNLPLKSRMCPDTENTATTFEWDTISANRMQEYCFGADERSVSRNEYIY